MKLYHSSNVKSSVNIIVSLIVMMLFNSCSQYGNVDYTESPKVINVSAYDPKETHRGGSSYSPLNQASLKRNGALGQIARCSKGYSLDSKCAEFLAGADRQNMLLGAYHYLQPYGSATGQADLFVNRLKSIKQSRGIRASRIVLVADVDQKATVPHIIRFVERINERTGRYPMIYIENGELIRSRLRNATRAQKNILKKCPYWLALYGDDYPGIPTPQALIRATGVWSTWALWQYGGVEWERGRSRPKHYRNGPWMTPRYFGDMSKPLERNGFNGSKRELYILWEDHGWKW